MSITFKFDASRFQADFRQRVERTKSTLDKVTNRTAYDVNRAALDATKRAQRIEIEKLGVSGYTVFTKATKNKPSRRLKRAQIIYDISPQLYAITVAWLKKHGADPHKLLPGQVQQVAKKLLASRLRAIGFVASSFVPILKKIGQALRISDSIPNAHQIGKPQGLAIPATPGWNPVCKFEVAGGLNLKDQTAESAARAKTVLENALGSGFNSTSDSMEKHAIEEINKQWP